MAAEAAGTPRSLPSGCCRAQGSKRTQLTQERCPSQCATGQRSLTPYTTTMSSSPPETMYLCRQEAYWVLIDCK